ncbi:hypothetical protein LX16_3420 [Stackebrandtia albiflava]|uniref:Uncharacterized protein n=1 Tax=Stackebrandtia albiflava TaxID=406432 RepID=A0A562V4B4_9ACTN|nr:hypothetical protein LX16_3420 [Stackebrandtia albiflava]
MDGNDRIRGVTTPIQSAAARRISDDVNTRPHFPDVIRGVTCQVCRTDWPCGVVQSRRRS